jgi:DNA damage-binding protein 1
MSIIRASILGAIDGIITSFTIISSAHATDIPLKTVIIIGISSLLSDGMSMGIGEYLSSRAEQTKNSKQLKSLTKEFEMERTKSIDEFKEYLKSENVQEYKKVAHYLASTPKLIARLKGYDASKKKNPILLGFSCFISFVFCGSVPLLFYILLDSSFISSIISSLIALFVIGLSQFRVRKIYTIEVLGLGTIAGMSSYFIGRAIDSMILD